MLPRIRRQAGYYLRHLSTEECAEGMQEVVANAFVSWVRLTEGGKSSLAYAGPLRALRRVPVFCWPPSRQSHECR